MSNKEQKDPQQQLQEIITHAQEIYDRLEPGATMTIEWKMQNLIIGNDAKQEKRVLIVTKPFLNVVVGVKA